MTAPPEENRSRLRRWLDIGVRLLWLELVGGYALLSLFMFWQRLDGNNPAADFVIYYGASVLILSGDFAAVLDWPSMEAAQAQVIAGPINYLPWLYPPPLMLVVAPLAALPYLPAFGVWVLAQMAALMFAVRTLGQWNWALIAAVVFPATVNNMLVGQNGALSAALLGGGLVILHRHPATAGILFGLLIYKPHLALVLPFVLVAVGAWRTIVAALVSAAANSGLSLIAFGSAPWHAFLEAAPSGSQALQYGTDHWPKMATVFAALRLAGADVTTAYAGQLIAGGLAIFAAVQIWRRSQGPALRGPAVLFATFLVTPYAFFYDLVVLVFAILWLDQGERRRGGPLLLGALWLAPVALWLLARYSQMSLWPILFAVCLAWLFRATNRKVA